MSVVVSAVGYLSLAISAVSLLVHVVCAHRLKCQKNAWECLATCLPSALASAKMVTLKNQIVKENDLSKDREKFQQTFTPYRDDYLLNKVTNELEKKPIPVNVQEYIDSHIESALERALERFMPQNVEESDDVADYTERIEDLSSMAEAMDLAEDYRDRYNLPDDMSVKDIYAFVAQSAKELRERIVNKSKVKEDKVDEEKS